MIEKRNINRIYAALLLCILQVAGISVFAQERLLVDDSLRINKPLIADTLLLDRVEPVSIMLADSLEEVNMQNMAKLDQDTIPLLAPLPADSLKVFEPKKLWVPNPTKATWLAVVFPGGGQIYNRKYWKLPIIYGGFAGCAYALTWNDKMYKDYARAYADLKSDDPTRTSYLDIFGDNVPKSRMETVSKKNRDFYRRYRDISIFAFVGVYLISIIDAYVDAELSNFDIGPDLSMRLEPAVLDNPMQSSRKAVGMQCSFRF
ncbi:hypothetical protein D0T50_05305 [Bacteroides sp. 214]|uniref:DUF5683 domain-containing protein n=1 Tax=Bacteroides sp. 214 TaxID=2302935 RepID=UPI0013D03B99|nr:DUF5683 domain-containing protein [Bacteroides sp. 214]NDW12305.1 hypothetical protein [Bacteroides sp. 214]